MLKTYEAILRQDHVEWMDQAPDLRAPARVQVTIISELVEESKSAERGREMREALEAAVRAGGLPGQPDGVEWQRQVRADRKLPGRDE